MKKRNAVALLLILIFFGSCLFTSDTHKETKIVGDYYIDFNGMSRTLLKARDNSSPHFIILNINIDSIGYNNEFIYGKCDSGYFKVYLNSDSVTFTRNLEFTGMKKI